ncbi:AraC family transcriptional regulator [Algivirga pacifica]|uniref:AraC family transcriptional regulator n=1 Tax=Algivirga pacifica TaxID=1162670 RepID=A0ABP9D8H3_9BACT
MKVLPFKIPKSTKESFRVQLDADRYLFDTLHQHSEFQIMLIVEGEGTVIAGDYINPFKEGDLFVIGQNMPHVFRNDPSYYEKDSHLKATAISVYFDWQSLGDGFFDLPESRQLSDFLKICSRSIQVQTPEVVSRLQPMLFALMDKKGIDRTIQLLNILGVLSNCQDYDLLASSSNMTYDNEEDGRRMDRIFKFTMENYQRSVSLDEVADIANMTPNAFCRYFKRHTRKTYVTLLNEVRIGQACKLLQYDEHTVTEVCFMVGFNNLSNFNRKFKQYMGVTPTEYGRRHKRALAI